MQTQISPQTKRELLPALRERYQKASRIEKTRILWHLLDCAYAAYIEPGWVPDGPRV